MVLDSESIPTLPVSRLLLYLCVHGALDGWLRLKWLADIAALLGSMTAEQLAQTVEVAAAASAAAVERRSFSLPGYARGRRRFPHAGRLS